MRKILVLALLIIANVGIKSAEVRVNDIIGDWIYVPNKGMVMAGDIVMNISATSISQSLYSKKNQSKNDMFYGSYYLSSEPAESWDKDMVGKSQSGSYLVRSSNNRMVQSEVSFDSDGMLVVAPFNEKNGWTMRFRRMSDKEKEEIKRGKVSDEMGLVNGYVNIKNKEKALPLLEIKKPGSLFLQVEDFAKKYNGQEMEIVRIGGPIDAYDLLTISMFDNYFPNIRALDLSSAWFVTDSIAYHSHEYPNCGHEFFSEVKGLHMVKDFRNSGNNIICKEYKNASYNACYNRSGWLVEEKKDTLYRHLCTTIDDCVSEFAFHKLWWLERIILPMSTKEIHSHAFYYCLHLEEVVIPPSVERISPYAFVGMPALTKVRVSEDSPLVDILETDLGTENSKIFLKYNPKLKIEKYSCNKPDVTFTITGRMKAGTPLMLVSDYTNHKLIKKLSSTDGNFSFKVTVPQYSIIGFNNLSKVVIAEGGDVYIDLLKDSVSGTPLNDKLNEYNKSLTMAEKELRKAISMLDRYANKDIAASLQLGVDDARKKLYSYISRYYLSNYNNCISAYLLARYYKDMPYILNKMLFMVGAPSLTTNQLLRNEWSWLREASRRVYIDYNAYSDTRFMTTLTNVKAGELNTLQTNEKWEVCERLKIEGKLNATDIRWLRTMCRKNKLKALDLSDADIVDEKGLKTACMPDSSFAFNCSLRYIALPKNTKVIGRGCFYDSNGLEYVKIYDDVQTIEAGAFANASNLHDFTLPANLEKIGARAFWQCSNIRNMVLPKNVKEIGRNAFGLCRNLLGLHIPAATEKIGKGITDESLNVSVSMDAANKNYKVISNVIVACNEEVRE